MIVIMAGGRGKRLMPLTKDTPKPMIHVNGKPMLEWIIKRFTDQGFREFTISLGYLGEKIEEYFGDGKNFGCDIQYVRETGPLGTAGALSLLPPQSSEVIVINGDVLASVNYKDLLRFHKNHGAQATVGASTHRVEIPFGVLEVTNYRLKGIAEKPAYDYPIAAGIYIFSPEAMKYLNDGYIDMPDFIQSIPDVAVFPISGEWHDIGTHEALCSMNS